MEKEQSDILGKINFLLQQVDKIEEIIYKANDNPIHLSISIMSWPVSGPIYTEFSKEEIIELLEFKRKTIKGEIYDLDCKFHALQRTA